MTPTNDSLSEYPDAREEEDSSTSSLQLKLAASIIGRLIERNGGSEAADAFWGDDALDALDDEDEYLDPELWDPDEVQTLPQMDLINWNIFGCD